MPPFESNLPNRPIAGAFYVLCASFLIAILGALIKYISASVPHPMVVFFRNFYALCFLLPWLARRSSQFDLKTSCFHLHIFRSVIGLAAMYFFFYTLSLLKLGEAVLLAFTNPIFIPIIAYIWLKEPVTKTILVAIFIGFLGIALILKPGSELFQPVSLFGLLAGFLAGVAMVAIRRLTKSEPAFRIVFYYSILATIISGFPLLWSWTSIAKENWWILITIGGVAVAGQLFLTKGYSLAPAAQVGPLIYGNVLFSTLIGWIIWQESLDLFTIAGAILVCIAGIVTTIAKNY